MAQILAGIWRRLFNARGTLYEADVFSVLSSCPYAVRSFEFALADGCLDCSHTFDSSSTWLERFWQVRALARVPQKASKLALFEVKSSTAGYAGRQHYIATRAQQSRVAFYIGKCMASPTYVDVIPNMDQDATKLTDESVVTSEEREEIVINTSKRARLPPSAYAFSDQTLTPYRMPIRLLPEAMRRIRRSITHGEVYANPWTQVSFPEWKPLTTHSSKWLEPHEDSTQQSAFLAVNHIMKVIYYSHSTLLTPNFVGVQPRIADFKLTHAGMCQDVFIQHKLDATLRKPGRSLRNVAVARCQGTKCSWYFSTFDRFDFLFYQFIFSSEPRDRTEFLFLPERVIPSDFYVSTSMQQDFSGPAFGHYRIIMDEHEQWVERIAQIIRDNPEPRAFGERPLRLEELRETEPADEAYDSDDVERQTLPPSGKAIRGRKEYNQVLDRLHTRFFYGIMRQCALSGSGLIVLFSTNHTLNDFGFCQYTWTAEQRKTFLVEGIPPLAAHELPADVEILPICLYSQYAECAFQGPNLRAQHMRRLDACSNNCLVVWDIAGYDSSSSSPLAPCVVPSDDIRPTSEQRAIFRANLAVNKNADMASNTKGEFEMPSLSVSALLSTGLWLSDYAPGAHGPFATSSSVWIRLYRLFCSFSGLQNFEHPAGHTRNPRQYRTRLQKINEILAGEHNSATDHMHAFD